MAWRKESRQWSWWNLWGVSGYAFSFLICMQRRGGGDLHGDAAHAYDAVVAVFFRVHCAPAAALEVCPRFVVFLVDVRELIFHHEACLLCSVACFMGSGHETEEPYCVEA